MYYNIASNYVYSKFRSPMTGYDGMHRHIVFHLMQSNSVSVASLFQGPTDPTFDIRLLHLGSGHRIACLPRMVGR